MHVGPTTVAYLAHSNVGHNLFLIKAYVRAENHAPDLLLFCVFKERKERKDVAKISLTCSVP